MTTERIITQGMASVRKPASHQLSKSSPGLSAEHEHGAQRQSCCNCDTDAVPGLQEALVLAPDSETKTVRHQARIVSHVTYVLTVA